LLDRFYASAIFSRLAKRYEGMKLYGEFRELAKVVRRITRAETLTEEDLWDMM